MQPHSTPGQVTESSKTPTLRQHNATTKKRKMDTGETTTTSRPRSDVVMCSNDKRVPDSQEEVFDPPTLVTCGYANETPQQVKPARTAQHLMMEASIDINDGDEEDKGRVEDDVNPVNCQRDSRLLSNTPVLVLFMKNPILSLVLFLCMLGRCKAVTVGSNALSIYALNVNGMVHVGKMS